MRRLPSWSRQPQRTRQQRIVTVHGRHGFRLGLVLPYIHASHRQPFLN